MSIILGLTPFIVFFVLMRTVSPLLGLLRRSRSRCCLAFANGREVNP